MLGVMKARTRAPSGIRMGFAAGAMLLLAACAGGLSSLAFIYPRNKVWDCGMTVNGFLAGYVAEKFLLGEGKQAWAMMLAHYDHCQTGGSTFATRSLTTTGMPRRDAASQLSRRP